MTSLRLHELAKALNTTAKTLMLELQSKGLEVKNHMAAVDAKMLSVLKKKHPDVEAVMKKTEASLKTESAATKPKKPKSPKSASTGKVVTQRSRSKQAAAHKASPKTTSGPEEAPAPHQVEIVQRSEGQAGAVTTVTLEQRVVRDGVLRRRRVEAPPVPPPAPTPTQILPEVEETAPMESVEEEVQEQEAVEIAPVEIEEAVVEPIAEVAEPVAELEPEVAPAVVEPEPVSEVVFAPPTVPVPASAPVSSPVVVRRNLSAPSRLKIIETPAVPPPRPVFVRPGQARPGATQAVSQAPLKSKAVVPGIPVATAPGEETEAEALARKGALHKKRGVTTTRTAEEEQKLTKKDLLGMMEEVEITRPLARRSKKMVQRTERRQTQITTPGASKRRIRIDNEITVADLADRMGIKATDVIRKLITMGQMATIHQKLDFETASLIAGEYNYEVNNVAETAETIIQADQGDDKGNLLHRAPIVTIMGHVDHGKTSLLDTIRNTRVAQGEAGGITQHIGAYQIEKNAKKLTFIDTPGHAAFTAMRARGASLTDIVVLVVAADEGVKPQTLEALAHAQAAKVPVIVAVNKIDKPEANPDRVMQELSGHNLVPEAWGGDTMYLPLSALTGKGVPELLEAILLQAEVLDLKANPEQPGRGIVIESRLDRGKGPVATVIVQTGTLRLSQPVVSGTTFGKVRAMFDDQGKSISEAGPSTPVEVLGFDAVPAAGEVVRGVSEDAIARKASELTVLAKRQADSTKNARLSLEDMYQKLKTGEVSELRVILKGDVQGSVEAIADSLSKIKHDKVKVNVLFKAVGGISESDIDLGAASGALVFGFNVRPTAQAKALAQRENVQIKTYEIIYELLDDVKLAMQGLLAPTIKESILGQASVREVFSITKVGQIAGCFVTSGKILRNSQGRLIRDSVVIYTAKIISLKRFKDDAREVLENFECGIRLENFNDIKVGDVIECFENISMAQAVG